MPSPFTLNQNRDIKYMFKTLLPMLIMLGLQLWQVAIFLVNGNKPMAVVFTGYAIASLGLIILAS
jgi:uncharacterized membrane protein